ncbi:hypothetical protein CBR_g31975 [Chara braunii]|uniref:DUF659 domain-containing protein n=1 Tax=Chara braunii TaxID=69332 RepID=A0A388LG49_CHABU|nr:hypothetical protein CBR_g31975 [Chara braunii]|eukprot:GBG81300.1 hypothetical protein CBR_g31975 [Chara braunii]
MRDAGEQINVDDDVEEVARAGSSGRERGKGIVSEPGGQQGQYFTSAHVSARTRAGADTAEAGASAGKRKEREEGDKPTAAAAAHKRMRKNTITESFTSKWRMDFKKKWLQFVYSQRLTFNVFRSEPWLDVVRHFRDLLGPVKVLWPSENEIADIKTIVHTANDVGDDLAEVRAPFYVTGATIMSDGRKSRDARPIVNFLVGGSRGVMLVRTMNREVRPVVAGYRSSCDVHVDMLLSRAVHEGVQTTKRNRLEFEKVAKLVEISANVRLLSHQRAGRGFALQWTLDESLLDVEGGIGIRPSWKGTDESRTREEVEDQRRSWQRDPCGSRAPPGDVGDVFGTRAATLHPYPQDNSDSEGREDKDEPAGPASATPAADERDEWSDPEDVRRRSDGDDLFVRVDLEEESGGRHGSPLERPRPTSSAPLPVERETDPGSAPSRGAESGIGHHPLRCSGTTSSSALPTSTEQLHRQPAGADRLQRLVRGPRQRLEDRLEGVPMPVQGDNGDRQGLVGGDGGALAGGGGGAEVDVAVEGIPMGGGGGFSEFGDMGMPPGESVGLARGESESRGDISVGMQDLLGQIGFADLSSFSLAMRSRHDAAGGGFGRGFEYGSRCSAGDARERVGTDRGATFGAGAASCRAAEARGDIAGGRGRASARRFS